MALTEVSDSKLITEKPFRGWSEDFKRTETLNKGGLCLGRRRLDRSLATVATTEVEWPGNKLLASA
jgi:hypothetical protein